MVPMRPPRLPGLLFGHPHLEPAVETAAQPRAAGTCRCRRTRLPSPARSCSLRRCRYSATSNSSSRRDGAVRVAIAGRIALGADRASWPRRSRVRLFRKPIRAPADAVAGRLCNHQGVNSEGFIVLGGPLFHDRRDAGVRLAHALEAELEAATGPVVVGLARGGVEVAAEVARALRIPLDALAVRKVGHPAQPEYALGAVAPGGEVFVRDPGGIPEEALAGAVAAAQRDADELDRRLHAAHPALDLAGSTCVLCETGSRQGRR